MRRSALAWLLGALVLPLLWVGAAASDPPNEVVYPPWLSTLAEVHPAHVDMACVDCHDAAPESLRASDSLLPTMEVCTPCHADTSPCEQCHLEYRENPPTFPEGETAYRRVTNPPTLARSASPKVTFSHRVHADHGALCQDCHEERADGGKSLPSMQRCEDCHGEQGIELGCAGCHLADASGKLETSFDSGTLVPTDRSTGGDHRFDFVAQHSLDAKVDGALCETCHTPASCERCHDGVIRPQEIHPPNYTLMHGMDSLAGETECSTCHQQQEFCVECHEETRVGEVATPPVGGRLHPQGFVEDPSSEVFHGEEARRSIDACVSCHSEATCVRCHAVIDPHPADFLDRCGEMLKQNKTACAKCHSDVSALRGPCGE